MNAELALNSITVRDRVRMTVGDVRALKESIEKVGLLHPIVVDAEHRLIAGERRLAAVRELGWTRVPVTVVTSLDDALRAQAEGDENVCRQDFSPAEAVRMADRLQRLYEVEAAGRKAHGKTAPGKPLNASRESREALDRHARESQSKAAKATGKSTNTLAKTRKVLDAAHDQESPVRERAQELADELEKPNANVNKAAKELQKALRAVEIAAIVPAPLTSLGPFPVLYVDPPWRYDFAEDTSRTIENHYPTMGLDDICAMDVPAADDSVLFLWVTSPKLPEGLRVVDAWGFRYVTSMVWVKDKIGMGYYARQQHELLLIAKRGALRVPSEEDRPSSVIHAPRLDHSAKPDQVYDLIERMYPLVERCELFQRRPRDGWAGWGNELEAAS